MHHALVLHAFPQTKTSKGRSLLKISQAAAEGGQRVQKQAAEVAAQTPASLRGGGELIGRVIFIPNLLSFLELQALQVDPLQLSTPAVRGTVALATLGTGTGFVGPV